MRCFFLSILSLFLLSSCASTRQWHSTDSPGRFTASFAAFNGKENHSVNMQKDDVLFVHYAISASSGIITLSIRNGHRSVWQKSINVINDTAAIHVTATTTGKYNIVISGTKAAGAIDVSYYSEPPKKVTVKTNRNIELFGIMMALDDAPEILKQKDSIFYNGRKALAKDWYAMIPRNYAHFKAFDTCHVMTLYKKMETEGFFYDFFVGFLLQVDEVPFAKLNYTIDKSTISRFSPRNDSVEAKQKANEFLQAFNEFSKAIDLDAFFSKNKSNYNVAVSEIERNIPAGDFIPIVESYYRKQFNSYNLIPSLNLFTSMGFGSINKIGCKIYNAFGPFTFPRYDDTHPDMGFNDAVKTRALAAHEFGHSFANPAIDSLPYSLLKSSAYLFEPIKDVMKKQAYGSWFMSLYEHLVRSGEVIIAEKIGDSARAQTILKENVDNGFIYLPFMVQALKKWDKNPGALSFNQAVLQMMLRLKEAYPTDKYNQ